MVGNGCVGHVCSPGMSLCGTGRSSIGQIGVAGDAIEHVQEARLAGERDDVDVAAVVPDRRQLRRRVVVEVPEVVVRRLEVPQALAGARVERDQAIGEQVGADAVGAVVVVGGRAGREVGDAALLVDRQLAPGVRAADVFPRVFRPRLVAELAWMRHGVELPDQLAGEHVVGAKIAGRRHVAFAGRRSEQNQVLEHLAGRARLDARRSSPDRGPSPSRRSTTPSVPNVVIDFPVVASISCR